MTYFHIFGDAFVDLFCFLKSDQFPEPGGDAELREPVKTLPGGSGLNTATHLQALLNASCGEPQTIDQQPKVSLHTALNTDDNYGRLLLSHAERHGFRLVNCRRPVAAVAPATGHCLAIVAADERSFMTHRGCIAEFRPRDINIGPPIDHAAPLHVHVAGYFNMPHFWDGTLEQTLLHIRQKRERSHRETVLSLVPQHDASQQWNGGVDSLISSCLDFVIFNAMEAMRIMCRAQGALDCEAVERTIPECDLVQHFSRLSTKTIFIVTRGAEGAFAFSNGQTLADIRPAVTVEAIDPTGAGDAFAAGFMHGIWAWKTQNDSVDETTWPPAAVQRGLHWGCAAGSATVQIAGASIPPDYEAVLSILAQQASTQLEAVNNS